MTLVSSFTAAPLLTGSTRGLVGLLLLCIPMGCKAREKAWRTQVAIYDECSSRQLALKCSEIFRHQLGMRRITV